MSYLLLKCNINLSIFWKNVWKFWKKLKLWKCWNVKSYQLKTSFICRQLRSQKTRVGPIRKDKPLSPKLDIKKKPWTYHFFLSGAPAWVMKLHYKSSKLAFWQIYSKLTSWVKNQLAPPWRYVLFSICCSFGQNSSVLVLLLKVSNFKSKFSCSHLN